MKRPYESGVVEDVKYFIGTEVEKTPAYGQLTFFVVGDPTDLEKISFMATDYRCTHIYLGSNQSFKQIKDLKTAVDYLLDKQFWVTIDFSIFEYESVKALLGDSIKKLRLIPQVSVVITDIETVSNNLTVKIDDAGFKSSNTGVWCIRREDLLQQRYFTDWNEYTKDTVLE